MSETCTRSSKLQVQYVPKWPATMHLGRLHERVDELRKIALGDDNNNNGNKNTIGTRSLPYNNFDSHNLDRP